MNIKLTKGMADDRITITRDDGSHTAFNFPKKGPVPHDAVHFYVERELGMKAGFWGKVADGLEPAEVGKMAADAGHASSSRARSPEPHIVELLQAERLVECFEAELWGGNDDDAGIMEMARAGWETSFVDPLQISSVQLGAIRRKIHEFAGRWEAMKIGHSMELEWDYEGG